MGGFQERAAKRRRRRADRSLWAARRAHKRRSLLDQSVFIINRYHCCRVQTNWPPPLAIGNSAPKWIHWPELSPSDSDRELSCGGNCIDWPTLAL